MAYAALISLKHTIQRLQNSCNVSFVPPSRETLQLLYHEVYDKAQSLPYILSESDGSSWRRTQALHEQIRETTCEFEDALESHISNQFLSQSATDHQSKISLDLTELNKCMDSFYKKLVIKLKAEYIKVLDNPFPDDETDDDDYSSSKIDAGASKSCKMIGLFDEVSKLKHLLTDLSYEYPVRRVSLLGMAGIGKTTLAKEIFNDPLIENHFDCRVFITVGPKYQLKEILLAMLAQLSHGIGVTMPVEKDERLTALKKMVYKSLKRKRYLIVFDDLWCEKAWPDLRGLFPEMNGSRLLVTTRLERVAELFSSHSSTNKIRFLNKEESWRLFREKVFGDEEYLCPPWLEKDGKKIAENCEGLPLTIITVANILSKADKTTEYWNEVAEKENSVFTDAYDQMSKVLFPSYKYLPQHLKACFLYMGIFPQNYEIPLSKISMLWCAEGFAELYQPDYIKFSGLVCLNELASASLVMIPKQSSTSGKKTCCLQSVFWHMCNKEAEKSKFSHVLNSRDVISAESFENLRGLCIRDNILLGIKEVNNLSQSVSTVRSLILFNSPLDDQHALTLTFRRLKLLRVSDAFTISFNEFPVEVLKLVQLRYLALKFCNGNIPTSISKLWNLQFLIVSRHSSKKSSRSQYLPMEIWEMKELKHIQIMGCDLQEPNDDAILPNLFTLLDVSAKSCKKSVLERIPNLMKLGIRTELGHDGADQTLSFFDHISNLEKLESLKCVVVNPKLTPDVISTPPRFPTFSSRIYKLSLSGFGFPWDDMRVIGKLPHLEALKLRCYAFRGTNWEIHEDGFRWLEYLLIEDSDLAHWTGGGENCFPRLRHLSLKKCYNLQEIPGAFVKSLRTIEVGECNPLVVTCAEQMEIESEVLKLNVHSS